MYGIADVERMSCLVHAWIARFAWCLVCVLGMGCWHMHWVTYSVGVSLSTPG